MADEPNRPNPLPATEVVPAARSDRSPWNWLLVIPIVVPLLTPLYNHDSPADPRIPAVLLAAVPVHPPRRRDHHDRLPHDPAAVTR